MKKQKQTNGFACSVCALIVSDGIVEFRSIKWGSIISHKYRWGE